MSNEPRFLVCDGCGLVYWEAEKGEGDQCLVAGVAFKNSPGQFAPCEGRLYAVNVRAVPPGEERR